MTTPPNLQSNFNVSHIIEVLNTFSDHHRDVAIQITEVSNKIQNLSEKISSPSNQYIMDEICKLQRELHSSVTTNFSNITRDIDKCITDNKTIIITHTDHSRDNIKEHVRKLIEDEVSEINMKIDTFDKTFNNFKLIISSLFGIAMIAWGIVSYILIYLKSP